MLFLHSHCPCSSATVNEVARIIAHTNGRLSVHAEFVRPQGEDDRWTGTSLYRNAAAIPGVIAEIDAEGVEAARFAAETSGQSMLYDTSGELVFSGGITLARGHEGDNPGETAIVDFVNGFGSATPRTPVFGCALSNRLPVELVGKETACRN
ncbi:MAG: hypothetical protein JO353_00205 [Phycisphaerae bacterium]|nr:hypothetical protein [Phycisphaerae bacterium]